MLPRLSNEHGGLIKEPVPFFSDLGNLHDAKIRRLEWNPSVREMVLGVDDLYSNFVDLPEHPGRQPVQLILSGVSKVEIAVIPDKFAMRIVDFEIEEVSGSVLRISVNVGPSGFIRIACESIAGSPE